jgi:hypothetical protein
MHFYTTSARIHGEFLRLLFSLANKQADDYFQALGYYDDDQPLKLEFCYRRSVLFQQLDMSRLSLAYDEYDSDERHVNGVA